MIKQTRNPIQSTKSMLLRDMEAKHLKSATIYDRDSEEPVILSIEAYFRTLLQYAETKGFKLTEFEQTLRRKGLRSQGVFITLNK